MNFLKKSFTHNPFLVPQQTADGAVNVSGNGSTRVISLVLQYVTSRGLCCLFTDNWTNHTAQVFNRGLGSTDEDATVQERTEKILYYFPNDVDVKDKVHFIETVESFVDFSRLLSSKQDSVHSLLLSDVWYAILECEPGTFMCMGVSAQDTHAHQLASLSETGVDGTSQGLASRLYRSIVKGNASAASEDKTGNVIPPSPDAMRQVLQQTYDSLVFLSGPFSERIKSGVQAISRLKVFFRKSVRWCLDAVYFPTLPCATLHELDGVEHLALEKPIFLQVQSFIESFELKFGGSTLPPKLLGRKYMILQNGALAWNSLSSYQARTITNLIYRLGIIDTLGGSDDATPRFLDLGEYHQQVLDGAGVLANPPVVSGSSFVTIGHQGSRSFAPIVYLRERPNSFRPVRIVALKRLGTILIFFLRVDESFQAVIDSSLPSSWDADTQQRIKAEEIAVADFLQRIHVAIGPSLEHLSSLLGDSSANLGGDLREGSSKSSEPVFLFYNSINLVVKGSPRYLRWAKINDSFRISRSEIPAEVMHALDIIGPRLRGRGEQQQLGNDECDDIMDGYTAVIAGSWCVAGWRSGGRMLYYFDSLNKVLGSYYYGSATSDCYLAFDKLYVQLEDIIQKRFTHVMMV